MQHAVVTIAALLTVAFAQAQEFGRVVSTTPVVGQVGVPQQFCQQGSVVVPGQSSGGGAALGAVTGAVIGGALGHGGGRAAGAVLGMVGGALIGDRLDTRTADQVQPVQTCTTQTAYENRVLYYDVVYEYAGRRYTVQMPSDPGPTVQIQVTPVGMLAPTPMPMAAAAPIAVAPAFSTIESSVHYYPYASPISVAPVVIGLPSIGWGYRRQHDPRYYIQGHVRGPGYGPGYGQRPYWR